MAVRCELMYITFKQCPFVTNRRLENTTRDFRIKSVGIFSCTLHCYGNRLYSSRKMPMTKIGIVNFMMKSWYFKSTLTSKDFHKSPNREYIFFIVNHLMRRNSRCTHFAKGVIKQEIILTAYS